MASAGHDVDEVAADSESSSAVKNDTEDVNQQYCVSDDFTLQLDRNINLLLH